MHGFSIYTTEYVPSPLYETGDVGSRSRAHVTEFVRSGDRPLDLLVDTGRGQILWTFRGDRRTKTTRTGNFVAAFRTDEPALFEAFADELHAVQATDGWRISRDEAGQWSTGFDLPGMEAGVPGLAATERDRLLGHLRRNAERSDPIVFGMNAYEDTLRVLKTIYEADVDCTVGIADESGEAPRSTDLLLCPNRTRNFEPLSESAQAIVASVDRPSHDHHREPDPERDEERTAPRPTLPPSLEHRVAGALLLIVLGFSLFSFVSPALFHPITGLAAVGGFIGSTLAMPLLMHRTGTDRPLPSAGSYRDALRDVFHGRVDHALSVITTFTIVAYLYPTVLRVSGAVLFDDRWIFGPVTTIPATVPSLLVYVGGSCLLGMALVRLFDRRYLGQEFDGRLWTTIAAGFIIYGFALFVTTGFAQSLWFKLM